MPKNDLTFRESKGSPLTFSEHDGNFNRLLYWSGIWAAPTFACGSQYCPADTDIRFANLFGDSPSELAYSQSAPSSQTDVDTWSIPVNVTEYDEFDTVVAQYTDTLTVTYDGITWSFNLPLTPTYGHDGSWTATADCSPGFLEGVLNFGTTGVDLSHDPCAAFLAADGPYTAQEVVRNGSNLMVANTTTTQEPTIGASDWDLMARCVYGFGEMNLSPAGTPAPFPDIGAGWTPITQYNQAPYDGNGVTFNTTDGTFQFSIAGVWAVSIQVSFDHNELNDGRASNLRLYNVTDGAEVAGAPFYIARNQPGSLIAATLWATVSQAAVDQAKLFRMEIGGGDDVSAILLEGLALQIKQID